MGTVQLVFVEDPEDLTIAHAWPEEHELCNNDYNVLEKQLTDILKRWISNVATFEKVR
jgi:hypothetical protein